MDKKPTAIQSNITEEIKVNIPDSKPITVNGYTLTANNISYEHLINGGNASLCTLKVESNQGSFVLELERDHSKSVEFSTIFDFQIGLESVSAYNEQSANVILKPK